MSDSRHSEENSDVQNLNADLNNKNVLYSLFMDYYKKILSLDSIASKNLVSQISPKLLSFLKSFYNEKPFPSSLPILKGHINRLVELNPDLSSITAQIQTLLDTYQNENVSHALSKAISKNNLITHLEDEVARQNQDRLSADALSSNIPNVKTGVNTSELSVLKIRAKNLEAQTATVSNAKAKSVVTIQNIQLYGKELAIAFEPFFKNIFNIVGDQPENLAFLEGSEIYAIRTESKLEFGL
jgi:hypothetical protein